MRDGHATTADDLADATAAAVAGPGAGPGAGREAAKPAERRHRQGGTRKTHGARRLDDEAQGDSDGSDHGHAQILQAGRRRCLRGPAGRRARLLPRSYCGRCARLDRAQAQAAQAAAGRSVRRPRDARGSARGERAGRRGTTAEEEGPEAETTDEGPRRTFTKVEARPDQSIGREAVHVPGARHGRSSGASVGRGRVARGRQGPADRKVGRESATKILRPPRETEN
mmetsp:Transcript_5670/g.16834  ORF Transcript_5670/g.16834 Transcript_5670/m.16834 type:complete len:226 (-) Transcript_5670:3741-4418(-)